MPSSTHSLPTALPGFVVDTRWVFRVYTWVVIVAGGGLVSIGLHEIERGIAPASVAQVWTVGMALVAAGCAASGLALNDDPFTRRRSLFRFALGHLLLGMFVWIQYQASWSTHGFPLAVAAAPLIAGTVLFAAAIASGPGFSDRTDTPSRIRSRYDEHIRQIARREERARLARDLHDAVKQQLFVIQTAAATVQTRFDSDPSGARDALGHVRTAAREATTEMEALLEELQAAPLENTGLIEALRKQCDALAARTGATVRFRPGTLPPAGSLPPATHEAIYRVAQEALANVARHARATRVDVALLTTAADVQLRISDNGHGFDTTAPRQGMGVSNMEARAREIGGQVSLTADARGVEVVLTVPLPRPARYTSGAVFCVIGLYYLVFYGSKGSIPQLETIVMLLLPLAVWAGSYLVDIYRRRGTR